MHRIADVQDDVAAQVGFFLELLDVILVGLGPDLPVEMANVVAGGVFAVLHEFDAVPEERTAVHARDEAFDHEAGPQIEARNAGDRIRVQEATRIIWSNGHG